MVDDIKNLNGDIDAPQDTLGLEASVKPARIRSVSLGEIAVLFNAIVIIVAIYLWMQPLVAQKVPNTAKDLTYLTQIDRRINLDFDLVENEAHKTAQLLIKNKDLSTREEYQDLIKKNITPQKFDQFYWVKKYDSRYKVFPLIDIKDANKNATYNFDINAPDKAIIAEIIRELKDTGPNKIHANLTPEKTTMLTKNIDEKRTMLIQPFVISQKVYGTNNEFHGYLIGLARSNKAFMLEGLRGFPSLSYLTINEENSGVTLLAYSSKVDSFFKLLGKVNNRDTSLEKWGKYKFHYRIESISHAGNKMLEYALYGFLILGGIYATFLFSVVRNNRIRHIRATREKEALIKRTISLGHEASENKDLKTRVDNVEQKNIALLNSINDIIIEADMNGVIVFVNGSWNRITDLGNAACLDKKLFSLLEDDDIEHHKKEFLMLIRGHKDKYSFTSKLICSDGETKDVDIVLTPIQVNDMNKDTRIVGTITNMQERNQAQKALSEVEARYKTIWERAAFGLFQLDTSGKYISANPALYKILGYRSLEEMQSKIDNANQQVYVNYRERMKFLRALEQNEEIKNWETQIRRKDGTLIWINENSRLVRDAEGIPLHIEGSVEDVTERLETSSSLESAKMDSDMANRAKSEFLANMSHELRTPLNAIIGFSEIIRDEVMGPIGQKAYWEYARDINNSGLRLLRIINEILDISRIETGDRELNDSIVDLKKLSEKCLDILGGKIQSSDLVLHIDIPDNTPNILGEELAIKQMLMNILSNAIKFTANKGQITISAEVEDKGSLRLAITDTGIGINESDIENALSPFTQLDGADMSRNNSGTGLGLTLVNALIKMHDGRLELVSQKGIGTTATLIFPLDRVLPKNVNKADLEMMGGTAPPQPDYNQVPTGKITSKEDESI